ncbi:MAG: lysylphosphatidylglycerol synthase transmembrane domain-containing protein [Chloroflexi bacterium]|nr:lysylphosphatidylglycerol synthase transmembrane domain-containing protein [Chloroflexota bacterium]
MTRRRVFIVVASAAVSVILLLLVLRDVPLDEVFTSLRVADAGLVLLALLMVAFGLAVRGIRWSILLGRRITYLQATHLVNIMFLGNQLPLRLGEVARGLLAARNGIPLATSASSIVAERLIDTLAVVLVIALTVSQLPGALPEVTERAALFGLLALVCFFALLGLARFPDVARRLLEGLLNIAPQLRRLPLESILSDVISGLKPLTQARTALIIVFWTVVGWIFSLVPYYCLHLALGIETDYVRSVPLGVALAALAIAVPVSIAGLGPFQGAIVVAGQMVGMDPVESISLGFLFHGVTVLSYALWGTVGLLALGISPKSAFASSDEAPADKISPE